MTINKINFFERDNITTQTNIEFSHLYIQIQILEIILKLWKDFGHSLHELAERSNQDYKKHLIEIAYLRAVQNHPDHRL